MKSRIKTFLKKYWPSDGINNPEVTKIFGELSSSLDTIHKEHSQLKRELMALEPVISTNEYLTAYVASLSTLTEYLVWAKNNDDVIVMMNDKLKFALSEYSGIIGTKAEEIVEIHETSHGETTLREMLIEDNDNDIPSTTVKTCRCQLFGDEKILRIRKTVMRNFLGERIGICGVIDDVTVRVHELENIKSITRSPDIISSVCKLEDIIFYGKK